MPCGSQYSPNSKALRDTVPQDIESDQTLVIPATTVSGLYKERYITDTLPSRKYSADIPLSFHQTAWQAYLGLLKKYLNSFIKFKILRHENWKAE
jgi:hypothetical protein